MLSATKVKTARELAWDCALTARMNVLYYQHKIRRWQTFDWITRIAAALMSSYVFVALLLANVNPLVPWLAGLAAVIGVVSAVLRVPETVRALGVLLAEYTAHSSAFERIYHGECSPEAVNAAIVKFAETEAREAKDDPTPNPKLLEKARIATLREIGMGTNAAPRAESA